MENIFLNRLIEELKDLNDTPKFQLERAISPLLGIFIKEIINKIFDAKVTLSIPEYPLKKVDNSQSNNIDWLLFDKQNKTLYFVELKTDTRSYSEDQFKIYLRFKDRIDKAKSALLLKSELDSIIIKSRRKEKYTSVLNKLKKGNIEFTDYQELQIVYLVPDNSDINNEKINRIDLSRLPTNIDTAYKEEWRQIKYFLLKLFADPNKQEGNLAVFKDLGIYSEDPEEDEKINQSLIKFLESKGYKMPEIKIIKSEDKSGA